MERLQKILARAGIASRRASEELITSGRVTVNGTVITRLGTRVDPFEDSIKVDGRRIKGFERPVYLVLNKPKGVLTSMEDPEGRPTVAGLIKRSKERVFPVGRLDMQSEGLLILTNDGDLARNLMHPSRNVPKTYLVKVRGVPEANDLRRLENGIRLDGRKTAPAEARIARPGANAWVQITISEGRKHQVRRMMDAVGHPVSKLRRIRLGGVSLGKLPVGEVRPLTEAEVARLKRAAATEKKSGKRP